MENLSLNTLKERFLSFFEKRGHLVIPSFSLVPKDDPSILLVNAGMAPLKPYFTGTKTPPSTRMASCQNCIRLPDIERVGNTSRHGTFFEMLGNFSFGDYFKQETILWAWEFLTEDLKVSPDLLHVSVYEEDDEAYEIWHKQVGLDPSRISRLGKEDNFWELNTGPCGPDSEIFFDRGRNKGCGKPDCGIICGCDRFVEVWNLVFTQFDKQEDGTYLPLKNKNIDTGMGLERLACLVQGVDSLFEVDTIRSILDWVCTLTGVVYREKEQHDVSVRIITDHIRSTVMMIADGILPSNEGRGYVLRRLMRRAARHGKLLGIQEPFLVKVAETAIREFCKTHHELANRESYIHKVIQAEEERFETTIEQGMGILKGYLDESDVQKFGRLSGKQAFKLYDTYGFPYELTEEIAREQGIIMDRDGYQKEMDRQREQARKAIKAGGGWEKTEDLFRDFPATVFTGYEETMSHAGVRFYEDGSEGAILVLDRTPFYAEGGGQAADTGMVTAQGFVMKVEACTRTTGGVILHRGTVIQGTIRAGEILLASVDRDRRHAIRKNHTSTHLLQYALRKILGDHVQQAGSHVDGGRLRFDFTHFSPLSRQELKEVQELVNSRILDGIPVDVKQMSLEEAQKSHARALFEEKYDEFVRVISIGEYSMELCGGTHLTNTAEAGVFKIMSESSISAGVRRIEAITGWTAYRYYEEQDTMLRDIAGELKVPEPEQVLGRIRSILQESRLQQQELERQRQKAMKNQAAIILEEGISVGETTVIVGRVDGMDMQGIRAILDRAREVYADCVAVVAGIQEDTIHFAGAATKKAVEKGIHMGNILKKISAMTGGGGGGRPDMAQAGGRDPGRLEEALETARSIIHEVLKP